MTLRMLIEAETVDETEAADQAEASDEAKAADEAEAAFETNIAAASPVVPAAMYCSDEADAAAFSSAVVAAEQPLLYVVVSAVCSILGCRSR